MNLTDHPPRVGAMGSLEFEMVLSRTAEFLDQQNRRVAELEKAFKWVLQNEVWFDRSSKRFYEYMGQGEVETREGPPEIVAIASGLADS